MPRKNSGGRPAPRPAPRRAPIHNPPHSAAGRAPPPTPAQGDSGGSLLGAIGATIAEGMAFGTGSAIAHRAVEAVLGPCTIQHKTVVSQATTESAPTMDNVEAFDSCNGYSKALVDCLNSHGSDISKCQFLMDVLSECRKNSASS